MFQNVNQLLNRVMSTGFGEVLLCAFSPLFMFVSHSNNTFDDLPPVFDKEAVLRNSTKDVNLRKTLFRSYPELASLSRDGQLYLVPVLHCIASLVSVSPNLRRRVSEELSSIPFYIHQTLQKARTGVLSTNQTISSLFISKEYSYTLYSNGLDDTFLSPGKYEDRLIQFLSIISSPQNTYFSSVQPSRYDIPSVNNKVDVTACHTSGNLVHIHPGARTSDHAGVVLFSYAFGLQLYNADGETHPNIGFGHQYQVQGTGVTFACDIAEFILLQYKPKKIKDDKSGLDVEQVQVSQPEGKPVKLDFSGDLGKFMQTRVKVSKRGKRAPTNGDFLQDLAVWWSQNHKVLPKIVGGIA